MLFAYFILLPLGPLEGTRTKYQTVQTEDDDETPSSINAPVPESAGLLAQPAGRSVSPAYEHKQSRSRHAWHELRRKLIRAKALVIPYVAPDCPMLPLVRTVNLPS